MDAVNNGQQQDQAEELVDEWYPLESRIYEEWEQEYDFSIWEQDEDESEGNNDYPPFKCTGSINEPRKHETRRTKDPIPQKGTDNLSRLPSTQNLASQHTKCEKCETQEPDDPVCDNRLQVKATEISTSVDGGTILPQDVLNNPAVLDSDTDERAVLYGGNGSNTSGVGGETTGGVIRDVEACSDETSTVRFGLNADEGAIVRSFKEVLNSVSSMDLRSLSMDAAVLSGIIDIIGKVNTFITVLGTVRFQRADVMSELLKASDGWANDIDSFGTLQTDNSEVRGAFEQLRGCLNKAIADNDGNLPNVCASALTLKSALLRGLDIISMSGANALSKIETLNLFSLDASNAKIFDSISTVYPIRWQYGVDIREGIGSFATIPVSFQRALSACWNFLIDIVREKMSRPTQALVTESQRARYFSVGSDADDYPTSDQRRRVYLDMSSPSTSKAMFVQFRNTDDDTRIFRLSGRTMQFVDFALNKHELIRKDNFVPREGEIIRGERSIRERLHNFTVLMEVSYSIAELLLQCDGWSHQDVTPLLPLRPLTGMWDCPAVYLPSEYTLSAHVRRPLAVVEIPGLTFFDSQTLYADHETLRAGCLRDSDSVYMVSSKEQLSFSGLDGYLFRTYSALALTTPEAFFTNQHSNNDADKNVITSKLRAVLSCSKAEADELPISYHDVIRNQLPDVNPDHVAFVDTSRSLKMTLLSTYIKRHRELPDPKSKDELVQAIGHFCFEECKASGLHYPNSIAHRVKGEEFKLIPSMVDKVIRDIENAVSRNIKGKTFETVLNSIDVSMDAAHSKKTHVLGSMIRSGTVLPTGHPMSFPFADVDSAIKRAFRDHVKLVKYFLFPMLGRDYRVGRHKGFPAFVPTERFENGANTYLKVHTLSRNATNPLKDGIRNVNGVHLLWKLSDYIRPIIMHLSCTPPNGKSPADALEAPLKNGNNSAVSGIQAPLSTMNLGMGTKEGGTFRPAYYEKVADGKDVMMHFRDKSHYEHWLAHVYAVFSEEFTKYCCIEVSQALLHNLFISLQEGIAIASSRMDLYQRVQVHEVVNSVFREHIGRVLVDMLVPTLHIIHKVLRDDLLTKSASKEFANSRIIQLGVNKDLLPDMVSVSRKCFKTISAMYLEGGNGLRGLVDLERDIQEAIKRRCGSFPSTNNVHNVSATQGDEEPFRQIIYGAVSNIVESIDTSMELPSRGVEVR